MSDAVRKLRQNLNMIFRSIQVEEIISTLDSLRESIKRDRGKVTNEFLRRIRFGSGLCMHPIVRKCIDWGNLSRMYRNTNIYRKLSEVINKAISIPDPTVISEISDLLERLRMFIINQIIQRYSEASEGLRHIHVPGSVARREARNLYFGEKYSENGLLEMALHLCGSIAIGNAMAIYSEDEELMQGLKRIIATYLGSEITINLLDQKVSQALSISRFEREKPFATLIRLLLWIKKISAIEQDRSKKELLSNVIERLRYAPITIFFMPDDRARWRMAIIPRLDAFFSVWLEDDERRKRLENLLNSIMWQATRFVREAGRIGERLKAENTVELIMHYYELLCEQLLEFGSIDYHSLRRIMDQLMELALRYKVGASFTSWRWVI